MTDANDPKDDSSNPARKTTGVTDLDDLLSNVLWKRDDTERGLRLGIGDEARAAGQPLELLDRAYMT